MNGQQKKRLPIPTPKIKRDKLLSYIETLQTQGRLVFTSEEAQKALSESPNAFYKASLLLMKKYKLVRPTSGFYVIVPTEYQSGKSVPPEWYIDALMKFHGLPYYVGILSAAAFHGAAHQAPQELQVITTKPLKSITINRTRIRFLTKNDLSEAAIQEMKTHTGYFKISTPETTAFDLIRYYRWAGYLNNIATVLAELSPQLDPKKLIHAAEAAGEVAHAQRVGFLLSQFGEKKSVTNLSKWISERKTKFIPLRAGWSGTVLNRDEKWRVLINDEVEPDL